MTTNTALTAERLQTLLIGLGNNADEIAATLRAAGIKGYRTDAHDCPAARFIAARAHELLPVTGQVTVTLTAETAVIGITAADPAAYREVAASTPQALEGFLDSFDSGSYDDLAETPGA
jgi:3-hydroxyisobutyrate dehydrogenase-like beta-hydroxyacid dehydrogenase